MAGEGTCDEGDIRARTVSDISENSQELTPDAAARDSGMAGEVHAGDV